MIGLLDYDWCSNSSTSTNRLIPNIEVMKLSSYYKIEEQQFCRMLTLEENDLTTYDKIFFVSEMTSQPKIPQNFLRTHNVFYCGSSFTNGKYVPFENEIIDYTLPRPAIYKDFLKLKYDEGIKYNVINHVLDDTYYRIYAGNKKLPMPAIIPNKRVWLYDNDFFYDDWEEIITKISERKPSSIIRLHPIRCTTLTQYFSIRKYSKLSRENSIILDINIPLEDVNYMFKKYKTLFLADIAAASNVYLPIIGTQTTKLQYVRDIIYKLNLLYCFWSQGIYIKLKYEPPIIGVTNPFETFTGMLESWSNTVASTPKRRDMTINDKIPKKKKNNFLQEEKDLIIKEYPTFNTLCNQSFNELKKEGRWRV